MDTEEHSPTWWEKPEVQEDGTSHLLPITLAGSLAGHAPAFTPSGPHLAGGSCTGGVESSSLS